MDRGQERETRMQTLLRKAITIATFRFCKIYLNIGDLNRRK